MSASPPHAPSDAAGTALPVGFDKHDHDRCVSEALDAAERHCAASGLRLTPARRRVLEILLEAHRAMGAYDVLERMRAEGLGSQPPAAYRALDFLVANGFAHRIEGLNAFVACAHPGQSHVPAFLHCRSCGAVAEAKAQTCSGALARAAEETGFDIEATVVEARGLCPTCMSTEGKPGAI